MIKIERNHKKRLIVLVIWIIIDYFSQLITIYNNKE